MVGQRRDQRVGVEGPVRAVHLHGLRRPRVEHELLTNRSRETAQHLEGRGHASVLDPADRLLGSPCPVRQRILAQPMPCAELSHEGRPIHWSHDIWRTRGRVPGQSPPRRGADPRSPARKRVPGSVRFCVRARGTPSVVGFVSTRMVGEWLGVDDGWRRTKSYRWSDGFAAAPQARPAPPHAASLRNRPLPGHSKTPDYRVFPEPTPGIEPGTPSLRGRWAAASHNPV
jgi:hypothetical protein